MKQQPAYYGTLSLIGPTPLLGSIRTDALLIIGDTRGLRNLGKRRLRSKQ